MTRTIANVGVARDEHPFAAFVFNAIETAGAIKILAARWNVPEESIRRYRDGAQSPTFERLCAFRLNPDERLQLCRILGGNQISVEPLSADDADRRRQSGMVGVTEHELRGVALSLTQSTQAVAEVLHESLADGQIDPAERQRMEQAVDQVQKTAGCLRPGFWQRIRAAATLRNPFGRA